MALRNRKEVQSGQLEGVHQEADPTKLKFGAFTRLENWTVAGIGVIKKKRGVEQVEGTGGSGGSGGA
jgi:hypothetical protein